MGMKRGSKATHTRTLSCSSSVGFTIGVIGKPQEGYEQGHAMI
jgi:hypothetical protein